MNSLAGPHGAVCKDAARPTCFPGRPVSDVARRGGLSRHWKECESHLTSGYHKADLCSAIVAMPTTADPRARLYRRPQAYTESNFRGLWRRLLGSCTA